jgi:hypothetical protein
MNYTDPKTWSFGEVVPSSDFNTYIRDNITWLYNQLPTNHFSKFRNYISWLSLDGFTVTGSGSAAVEGLDLHISTPASANTEHVISKGTFGPAFCATGKAINCEWSFGGCTAITSQTIKLLLTTDATIPTPDNSIQFGFKISNAEVYSITGDGSGNTQTDTGIAITTGRTLKRFRAQLTPGIDCKFYIDDTWVATHTTHLPATASDFYLAMMVTSGASAVKDVYLQRFLVEREY